MNLILVTDIFGRTPWLDQFALELTAGSLKTEIIDPYNGGYCNFTSEDEAYKAFQEHIALEEYAGLVKNRAAELQSTGGLLLGFSVGASAIWLASRDLACGSQFQGICFYSSQLRHYLEINPKFRIDLYFAAAESTYDIDEVASVLSDKPRVTCFKTAYSHGFLNKASKNFNGEAYREYRALLRRQLQRHLHPE